MRHERACCVFQLSYCWAGARNGSHATGVYRPKHRNPFPILVEKGSGVAISFPNSSNSFPIRMFCLFGRQKRLGWLLVARRISSSSSSPPPPPPWASLDLKS